MDSTNGFVESAPLPNEAKPLIRREYETRLHQVYGRRDGMFAWLMLVQWVFGIGVALVASPQSWAGRVASPHLHVYLAVFLGAALSLPPILLARRRPGWVVTRHTVAVAQMMWSVLLIQLTGGRVETNFHVFGSLAFLAFYRDWKVLLTGTAVVFADHLARGFWWPESVYGMANPEWWRTLEYGFWVLFEDTVLLMGIRENRREMLALVRHQAELEKVNASFEDKVRERTHELESSREQYRSLVESTRAVAQDLLTDLLGVAVRRLGRFHRRVLTDRQRVGLAVDGARRAEDEAALRVFGGELEQIQQ